MSRQQIASHASRYSAVAIVLHWLIAALILFEVGLGLRMEDLRGPSKFAVFQLHKSVGITILLLAALRLLWRFYRKPPPVGGRGWERPLAHAVHMLFYLLLFALPLSGWVTVSSSRIVVPTLLYGTLPWPDVPGLAAMTGAAREAWHGAAEFIHVNLVTLIYGLFALHVAGALKHHVIDRDEEIGRMAPGTQPGAFADPRLIAIGLGALVAAALGFQLLPVGTPASTAAPVARPIPAPIPEPVQVPVSRPGVVMDAPTPEAAKPEIVPSWAIASGSALQFHTTWSGAAIDGGFARFTGTILFSPDQLDKSNVEIRIDTGSVFSGDGQRDETLKSSDWFAVATHTTAIFKADRFEKTGRDRFLARGTLSLKDVTLPVSLPFTLTINGKHATMRGSATIDRTAYKIGEGDYASTTDIPAAVAIAITVKATQK